VRFVQTRPVDTTEKNGKDLSGQFQRRRKPKKSRACNERNSLSEEWRSKGEKAMQPMRIGPTK